MRECAINEFQGGITWALSLLLENKFDEILKKLQSPQTFHRENENRGDKQNNNKRGEGNTQMLNLDIKQRKTHTNNIKHETAIKK